MLRISSAALALIALPLIAAANWRTTEAGGLRTAWVDGRRGGVLSVVCDPRAERGEVETRYRMPASRRFPVTRMGEVEEYRGVLSVTEPDGVTARELPLRAQPERQPSGAIDYLLDSTRADFRSVAPDGGAGQMAAALVAGIEAEIRAGGWREAFSLDGSAAAIRTVLAHPRCRATLDRARDRR